MKTYQDFKDAMQVRQRGYGKYLGKNAVDDLDLGDNCILLLARNQDMEPVGTLRLLNRQKGPVEVEQQLPLDELLGAEGRSVMEATRLSVPLGPHSREIKLLLWKALMLQCRADGVGSILIWVRRGAARDYRGLQFRSLGEEGVFSHATLAGVAHETFVTDLATMEERFRLAEHPLHHFFFVQDHNIQLWS